MVGFGAREFRNRHKVGGLLCHGYGNIGAHRVTGGLPYKYGVVGILQRTVIKGVQCVAVLYDYYCCFRSSGKFSIFIDAACEGRFPVLLL